MIHRALDADNDWKMGKGLQSFLYDNAAIAMNIQTRLQSYIGNCFWDIMAGIDWTRLMSQKNTQRELELTIRARILESFGVVKINSMSVYLDRDARDFTIQFNIDTIFSSNYTGEVTNG